MSGCCPPETLSALADGALSHDERDRTYAHLAGCSACRVELDALRTLKARLSGLAATTPAPPPDLQDALCRLAVPPAPAAPAGAPVLVSVRRPAVVRHSRRHRRLRRSSAVGGLVVLGVGAVLLLGGGETPSTTPVDPGSEAFVVDYASTTGDVPVARPVTSAASVSPAGR